MTIYNIRWINRSRMKMERTSLILSWWKYLKQTVALSIYYTSFLLSSLSTGSPRLRDIHSGTIWSYHSAEQKVLASGFRNCACCSTQVVGHLAALIHLQLQGCFNFLHLPIPALLTILHSVTPLCQHLWCWSPWFFSSLSCSHPRPLLQPQSHCQEMLTQALSHSQPPQHPSTRLQPNCSFRVVPPHQRTVWIGNTRLTCFRPKKKAKPGRT